MRSVFLFQRGKPEDRLSSWKNKLWTLLFAGILFQSCASSSRLSSQVLSIYESALPVSYRIWSDQENTQITLSLPSGRFSISLFGISEVRSNEILFSEKEDYQQIDPGDYLLEIPSMPTKYLLHLNVLDKDNSELFSEIIDVDLTEGSSQKIYIRDVFGNVITRNHVSVNASLSIKGPGPVWVKYFPEDFPASYPPYAEEQSFFDPDYGFSYQKKLKSNGEWAPDNFGLYLFTSDPDSGNGIFLTSFNKSYPDLTNAYELIKALRYITKNTEYESLLEAEDSKSALDEFWLERAGSKERARKLIQKYYSRVRSANKYFTSYKEGWKTDRGMIYIVFGEPNGIRKSGNLETWFYKYNGERQDTRFFFDHQNGILKLRRYPMLEPPWNSEIKKWRLGILSDL